MEIQALGLIEIKGFLGAIAAADAALKTASVTLLNAEKIRGGLTTIQVSGDVAAVQVAVAAGSAVARDLNCLKSSHVIPRLAAETAQMVTDSIKKTATEAVVKTAEKPVAAPVKEIEETVDTVTVKQTTETISAEPASAIKETKKSTKEPKVAPKKPVTKDPKKKETPKNKKKK